MDEAIDDDNAWLHERVMNVTFHDNMFTSLNFGFTTQAAGRKMVEESLSVFTNGGMSSSHVNKSRT